MYAIQGIPSVKEVFIMVDSSIILAEALAKSVSANLQSLVSETVEEASQSKPKFRLRSKLAKKASNKYEAEVEKAIKVKVDDGSIDEDMGDSLDTLISLCSVLMLCDLEYQSEEKESPKGDSFSILSEALAKSVGESSENLVFKELAGVSDRSEAIKGVYKKYNTLIKEGVVDAVLKDTLKTILMFCCKEQINFPKDTYENDMEQAIAKEISWFKNK